MDKEKGTTGKEGKRDLGFIHRVIGYGEIRRKEMKKMRKMELKKKKKKKKRRNEKL